MISTKILELPHVHNVLQVANKVGALKKLVTDSNSCAVHLQSTAPSGNSNQLSQCRGLL
jgi:hypothetical protein